MFVILAARDAVTNPPPVTPAPTIPSIPQPRLTIDLLGVNGDVIRLTGGHDGLQLVADPEPYGFWIGDFAGELQRTPGVAGARYGEVQAEPRPVGLTVRFDVPTVPQRRALADRLARALNPTRGLAGFLVTEADNTARMITGRYAGSSERWKVARQRGTWGIDLMAADDPFWMDGPGSELPARTWRAPELVDFYPYLPWDTVEDSSIGEPIDINNTGHEDIPPDWLLHGPATSALLVNETTGEELLWEGVLAAGKWIAVITKPGMQQVIDSDGVDRFYELAQDPEPAFWHLAPGVNTIRTVVGGIGEGTRVTLMDLARRWLIQG